MSTPYSFAGPKATFSSQQRPPMSYRQAPPSAASSTANLLPPSEFRGVAGPPQPAGQLEASIRSMGSLGSTKSGYSPSMHSLSDKFSLSPDPSLWDAESGINHPEPDDFLHNPDPRRDRKNDKGGSVFTSRGCANLGCLLLLCAGLLTLFAGYPLITYFTQHPLSRLGAFNLGGTNASGQIPDMVGNWGLIDKDTPDWAYSKPSWNAGEPDMQLVFSDEFNVPNRSFYPGDDPYWEAVDLHYWATNNMEWYDPSQVTTENGALKITMAAHPEHDLNFTGGMISTWNKFCFTGGYFEAAVILPGTNQVAGLWPAVWTMGNLGRAGYGATLEGMWPYTYDNCDVGTLKNQTKNGEPVAATINGDEANAGGALSYLSGQRLSACTCQGESHPGPLKKDGTLTGRGAPEIDMFEAQVDTGKLVGTVSQSGQWAPFNHAYQWNNNSQTLFIKNPAISELNGYKGGAFQQATSVVSQTNQDCYSQSGTNCYSVYGLEYKPGYEGYITWINNNDTAWTQQAAGVGADPIVNISARPIPQEPMYLLANLGMSTNFGTVDLANLQFPVSMYIDYIRVYQPKGQKVNIGCDPPDFPTSDYINTYIEAYTNPNLTTWHDDFKQPVPKNSLIDTC